MAIKPSQGQTFGYAAETALGTNGGTFSEIRYNESITHPTHKRIAVANPNKHAHPFNFEDLPIHIEKYREGALSFSTHIRRSSAVDTAPPIALFFQSGGCDIDTTTKSSVASYVDESNFDLGNTGDAYGIPGNIIAVKINDGTSDLDDFYYPALIADKTSDTIDLAMELPAATANGEPIEVMTTITPISAVVGATETLSFRHQTRGDYGGSEDLTWDFTACALSGVAEMTMTHGQPVTLELTFHVGKITESDVAFAAETFVDSEKFCVIDDNFRFGHGTYAAKNISRSDYQCKEAKVTWGFKSVPIAAEGDGTVAGLQGYMLQADGAPKVTITAAYAYDGTAPNDEYSDASLTQHYIELVQPTDDLDKPAMGFFAPRCYIDPDTPVVTDYESDSYVIQTVTYVCTSAELDSGALPSAVTAAPWFFGISGEGA